MQNSRKIYYTMGEVAEMFDVNPSLIRFWEQKFDILKPDKNRKGNRLFTPADVENLKLIYHLVKENGMTLAGAQKRLKAGGKDIVQNLTVIEKLQDIKAQLLEVKQALLHGNPDTEIIIGNDTAAEITDIPVEGIRDISGGEDAGVAAGIFAVSGAGDINGGDEPVETELTLVEEDIIPDTLLEDESFDTAVSGYEAAGRPAEGGEVSDNCMVTDLGAAMTTAALSATVAPAAASLPDPVEVTAGDADLFAGSRETTADSGEQSPKRPQIIEQTLF